MVLREEDPGDRKFDRKATVMIGGREMKMSVYGDAEAPDRRTVIGPDYSGDLPDEATVKWMGSRYQADLTFRYRKGGGSVPAYQWFVD